MNNPHLKSITWFCIFVFVINVLSISQTNSETVSKIIALVNGKPITQSDFQNRARFLKANNPDTDDGIISNLTFDELINEAIKISAAEELGLTYSEDIILNDFDSQLKTQGTNLEEYINFLKSNSINPQTIINQRIASTLWNQYILRKYRRLADITNEEINLYKKELITNDTFDIQILTIKQSSYVEGYNIAEKITNNFESCAKNLSQYREDENISIENKFSASLSDLPDIFSTLLEYKHNQFIMPIQNINNKITVMINCTPKKLQSDFEIENILVTRQLEFFAEKELRNLRQDSIIEFKS
jgi:hypothetical protein